MLLFPISLFRTLYIEGERKLDFAGWCAAIQVAAGSGGDTLSQQQLTETDIPVIVHSCISYITQCGERRTEIHTDPPSHNVSHTYTHIQSILLISSTHTVYACTYKTVKQSTLLYVVVFLAVSVCANLAPCVCLFVLM